MARRALPQYSLLGLMHVLSGSGGCTEGAAVALVVRAGDGRGPGRGLRSGLTFYRTGRPQRSSKAMLSAGQLDVEFPGRGQDQLSRHGIPVRSVMTKDRPFSLRPGLGMWR